MKRLWENFLNEMEGIQLKFEEKYPVPNSFYDKFVNEFPNCYSYNLSLTSERYSHWIFNVRVLGERIIFSFEEIEKEVADFNEAIASIENILNSNKMATFVKRFQNHLKTFQ